MDFNFQFDPTLNQTGLASHPTSIQVEELTLPDLMKNQHVQVGNDRSFHTLQGLMVRVPGGQGGGSIVQTLTPLYPFSGVRVITLASQTPEFD